MAGDSVRIGVIGVGGMGSSHCSTLNRITGGELAAVCDIDPDTCRRVSTQYSVPGYGAHEELIASGLVDAVIIATPHYFHPPIAIDAFRSGLHVLSEKPIAVTVAAADAMIEAARASGCRFCVMYQMRAEPQNQAARQVVESGRLGEIYRTSLVMGWYRSQAYYNSGGWRATWSGEGGGVLINQAPHALDLFAWLAGLPSIIEGRTRTRLHDIEVEDEAFAFLEYANGAHGYLYASTTEAPDRQVLEICGDRGKLLLDGANLKVIGVNGSIREFTTASDAMWASPKSEEVVVTLPPKPDPAGHAAIIQNFVRSIVYGDPLLAPGEAGLDAVELINGVILSGFEREAVRVPVPRAQYEGLITRLQAGSRRKTTVSEQRVTDPKFA